MPINTSSSDRKQKARKCLMIFVALDIVILFIRSRASRKRKEFCMSTFNPNIFSEGSKSIFKSSFIVLFLIFAFSHKGEAVSTCIDVAGRYSCQGQEMVFDQSMQNDVHVFKILTGGPVNDGFIADGQTHEVTTEMGSFEYTATCDTQQVEVFAFVNAMPIPTVVSLKKQQDGSLLFSVGHQTTSEIADLLEEQKKLLQNLTTENEARLRKIQQELNVLNQVPPPVDGDLVTVPVQEITCISL